MERTTDQHDAYTVAEWMRYAYLHATLAGFFDPSLTAAERAVADVEG